MILANGCNITKSVLYGFPYFPTSVNRFFFFFEEGWGGMVGYCMMIESYFLNFLELLPNKLRKDCFLKHHGLNDPERERCTSPWRHLQDS